MISIDKKALKAYPIDAVYEQSDFYMLVEFLIPSI